MGDRVEDFSRLWDGTEPGWVLVRMDRQLVKLSLVFQDGGPSVRDVQAVRRAVPGYAAQSAMEALAGLRGKTKVDLGEFEVREGREIAAACVEQGLAVRESVEDRSGYLPVNEITNRALLIDDDRLSKQVCKEALRRGVTVRYVET